MAKPPQGRLIELVGRVDAKRLKHLLGDKARRSNLGHLILNAQYSCVFVGCHLRRKVFEFAVSHDPHNPKVGGSNPPSATRTYSVLMTSKYPATIRIDKESATLMPRRSSPVSETRRTYVHYNLSWPQRVRCTHTLASRGIKRHTI
jgi:hypothetical protein